jgi:outer membrane protein assembly factor BamA
VSKPSAGRFVRAILFAFMLFVPGLAGAKGSLTLTKVQIVGTSRLSTEDVVRGLGLKVGRQTTRADLLRTCDYFKQLKLFQSSRCRYRVDGHNISLTIFVDEKRLGWPVVFQNFVWTTREELLARLKKEIPLFMPELPESSGLTNDIIRVLEEAVVEHGIKAHVGYDDSFWTIRGMNVFFVYGISTPVTSVQIEGENAPPPEEFQKWAQFYTKEEFSAARLTWIVNWLIRDFYTPRGYLRPVVGKTIVQCLGEKDGTYPVRVILRISSGDLYKFDAVKFEGLAEPRSASLLAKWKLKPGDTYDEAYVSRFMCEEISSAPWAQHSKTKSDDVFSCTTIGETSQKVLVTIRVEAPRKAYAPPKEGGGCSAVREIRLYYDVGP